MHAYIQPYTHKYIRKCLRTCTITYVHTYIRTYVHTYIHACIHASIHTFIHTYVHTYLCTYIHTCIHTYIHTHMRTYIHQQIQGPYPLTLADEVLTVAVILKRAVDTSIGCLRVLLGLRGPLEATMNIYFKNNCLYRSCFGTAVSGIGNLSHTVAWIHPAYPAYPRSMLALPSNKLNLEEPLDCIPRSLQSIANHLLSGTAEAALFGNMPCSLCISIGNYTPTHRFSSSGF